MALERQFRIVQLDECMVTKRTIPTHAWTLPKTNINLDQRETNIEAHAILLAVSREYGIDHIEVFRKSVNKKKFKSFLENLRSKYPFEDIMLVMDNLSLHKSKDTRNRMDELGFLYTYTPAYSPQYNGIEEVIGIGKTLIKKRRLDTILGNEEENLEDIIYNSFKSISSQPIAKCINRSLAVLGVITD